MAAPVCLLCSKTTLPQKRVYFRNLSEEPLLSLKQVLTGEYSEETITEHLKEPVIVCKGKCEGLIKKLSKSKVDLKKIEAEVLEKMKANFANIPHVNIHVQQIPPSTPQRERVSVTTPVRNILSAYTVSHAKESPSVSVSYYFTKIMY